VNKYLATDLDGTLLHPKSQETYVCNDNTKIVNKFNNRVIIISGRNPQFIIGICNELKLPHTFVACNGALIYENGKNIFTSTINGKIILDILEYIQKNFTNYYIILFDKNGALYSIFDNEKIVIEREEKAFKSYPKLSYKTNKNIDEINRLISNNEIIKVNFIVAKEQQSLLLSYLETNYQKLSLAICSNSVEITNENVNKGLSLQRLTHHLNINDNDVYVIGDDGNDLSMFNLYKNSFLIKNDKNKFLENKVKQTLDTFSQLIEYMEE